MKELILFGALALGMLSFTSDKANKQLIEEGPNDCAVESWQVATGYCNIRPGGCNSAEFSFFAGVAYDECLARQQ